MSRLNEELGRREFLKRVTQAAAAGAVSTGAASAAVPKEKKIDLADTIPTRVLGKTGFLNPESPNTDHRSAFTLERDCIPMNLEERLTNRLGSVWFLTRAAIRR